MAYTNIDDPSAHFQAFTYTGTGTTNSITLDGNSDLQPDLYWYKTRSNSNYHYLADSSRGTTKYIYPNDSLAEGTVSSLYVQSFDTNGVTLGAGDSGTNTNGTTFANWAWKANGGTTSSNTDGTITSTVQANQDAGFSIGTYTGNGTTTTTSIGHGLGVRPNCVIIKNRTSLADWVVAHDGLAYNHVIRLNITGGQTDSITGRAGIWEANNQGTSSVFSVFGGGTGDTVLNTNKTSNDYVFYAFAEKQGYSKFNKYVGNGANNGPFIYTGFKPAFVLTKGTNASQWRLYDSARSPNNVNINRLFPYSTSAEATDTDAGIDMLSNGFKIRGSGGDYNASGTTYIYMAFADNPLVTSTGIPTTAR